MLENYARQDKGRAMKMINILILAILTSCTYSVNLIHTQGSASDVLDEDQRAEPTVSPTMNIPITPL